MLLIYIFTVSLYFVVYSVLLQIRFWCKLREGFNKKKTSFYPHLVDKGGVGSADVDNFFFL